MKTSLRKLRGFGLHKHEPKDRVDLRPLAQLDELAQASRVFLLLPFCSFSFLYFWRIPNFRGNCEI